tara:strand:+ start:477 stop:671 length:195 start_codon:yes stop_codon:yes gene_type:complete
MPKLLKTEEQFEEIINDATECRVVKRDDQIKIKLRTKKLLYIYITDKLKGEELLKKVKVDKIEY